MEATDTPSPPLLVSEWLNTSEPVTLAGLRGRVIVLYAFQMLCPGCVSDGLPQAVRINALFPRDRVAVIGLHTVFEHHDVMGPKALRAFVSEYRIRFPVGIDQAANDSAMPLTMRAYGLQGTPSLVVFDVDGRVRFSRLGHVDDLHLGAVIGELLVAGRWGAESVIRSRSDDLPSASCDDEVCSAGPQPSGRRSGGA